jgi:alkylhydroperoxidase family enzyme
MIEFKLHDIGGAPITSRNVLEKIKSEQGQVHNIYAVMAESPLLLKGHAVLMELFEQAGLSDEERRVVLLTASRENRSAYSVALQSDTAEKHDVRPEVIEAIRASKPIKEKKLEALRSFTAKVVNSRGQVSDQDIKTFLDAGYTRANVLEIVLAAGMVTLTNYTNLITRTPLDKGLEPKMWKSAG